DRAEDGVSAEPQVEVVRVEVEVESVAKLGHERVH
ncbi:hypothetical protein LCGC14_2490140, partial [marine sediment metagenome]